MRLPPQRNCSLDEALCRLLATLQQKMMATQPMTTTVNADSTEDTYDGIGAALYSVMVCALVGLTVFSLIAVHIRMNDKNVRMRENDKAVMLFFRNREEVRLQGRRDRMSVDKRRLFERISRGDTRLFDRMISSRCQEEDEEQGSAAGSGEGNEETVVEGGDESTTTSTSGSSSRSSLSRQSTTLPAVEMVQGEGTGVEKKVKGMVASATNSRVDRLTVEGANGFGEGLKRQRSFSDPNVGRIVGSGVISRELSKTWFAENAEVGLDEEDSDESEQADGGAVQWLLEPPSPESARRSSMLSAASSCSYGRRNTIAVHGSPEGSGYSISMQNVLQGIQNEEEERDASAGDAQGKINETKKARMGQMKRAAAVSHWLHFPTPSWGRPRARRSIFDIRPGKNTQTYEYSCLLAEQLHEAGFQNATAKCGTIFPSAAKQQSPVVARQHSVTVKSPGSEASTKTGTSVATAKGKPAIVITPVPGEIP